jgi:hypothetical protein
MRGYDDDSDRDNDRDRIRPRRRAAMDEACKQTQDSEATPPPAWLAGKGDLPRFDLFRLIFDDLGFTEHDEKRRCMRLHTYTGQTITVSGEGIHFSHGADTEHEVMKRAISLAGERNRDWTAYGSLDFQRTCVAYGFAYGLNITAEDQAQFTAKDWLWVKRKIAQIGQLEPRGAREATGYDEWKSGAFQFGDVPPPTFVPQYRPVGPAPA